MDSILKYQFKEYFWFIDEGKLPISYMPNTRSFYINLIYTEAFQKLIFCPWSGKRFPEDLHLEFCCRIEKMGFEFGDKLDNLPIEYQGEQWWIDAGL